MKKFYLFIFCCILLVKCLSDFRQSENQLNEVKVKVEEITLETEKLIVDSVKYFDLPFYKIENATIPNNELFSVKYYVRLQGRINKDLLNLIARDIITKNPTSRTVDVHYYLPSSVKNDTLWAYSYIYKNNIETIIEDEDQKEESKHSQPSLKSLLPLTPTVESEANILGNWVDKSVGNIYVIYKINNKYYWKSSYSDGSEGLDELVLIKKNGYNRFYQKDLDRRDEYYAINNGILSIFDKTGKLFQQFN